jgi:hypothetical protein
MRHCADSTPAAARFRISATLRPSLGEKPWLQSLSNSAIGMESEARHRSTSTNGLQPENTEAGDVDEASGASGVPAEACAARQ